MALGEATEPVRSAHSRKIGSRRSYTESSSSMRAVLTRRKCSLGEASSGLPLRPSWSGAATTRRCAGPPVVVDRRRGRGGRGASPFRRVRWRRMTAGRSGPGRRPGPPGECGCADCRLVAYYAYSEGTCCFSDDLFTDPEGPTRLWHQRRPHRRKPMSSASSG